MIEKDWTEDPEQVAIIKNYVYKDRLVGPVAADRIEHPVAKKLLFEYYDRIYRDREINPSFIVGRRGSGKTAYLDHIDLAKKYDVVIKLNQDKLIEDTLEWMNRSTSNKHFVEPVSSYWDSLFYTLLAAELLRIYPALISENEFISKFLGSLNVTSNGSATGFVRRLMERLTKRIQARADKGDIISAIFYDFMSSIDEPHLVLKRQVDDFCRRYKLKVVILIDSLERYNLDTAEIRSSVEGFLKSVGNHDERFRPQIKCCIPSELFYHFRDISTNVEKDFSSSPLFLHWRPLEILSMVAHRMLIHINLYDDGDQALNKHLKSLDVSSRDGTYEFFRLCFDDEVVNECGVRERPETFILRHTQLTPRQAILIFHSILKLNRSLRREYARIPPHLVTQGTYQVLNELASGVCGAYHFQYPYAWRICRDVVNRLPYVFGYKEMDNLYRAYVRKLGLPGLDMDEFSLARMLIEIGCIGPIQTSTDRYIICQYEFNSRGELIPSRDSRFCVHPMFRGPVPSCGGQKTIYPSGLDPWSEVNQKQGHG